MGVWGRFGGGVDGTVTTMEPRPLPGTKLTTGLAGVSFHQDATAALGIGDAVQAVAEPDNPADPHAIRVDTGNGRTLGHIPVRGGVAARLAATSEGPWPGTVTDIYDPPQPDRPRCVTVTLNLHPTPSPNTAGTARTGEQVAAAYGGGPHTAGALVRAGRLYSTRRGRQTVYPDFQFDASGRVRPAVFDVRNRLVDRALTGAAALTWWETPNDALDGATPAAALATRPAAVVAAAGDDCVELAAVSAPPPPVDVWTPGGRHLGAGILDPDTGSYIIRDDAGMRRYPAAAVRTTGSAA